MSLDRMLFSSSQRNVLLTKEVHGFNFDVMWNPKCALTIPCSLNPKSCLHKVFGGICCEQIKALDVTLEGISSTLQKVPKLKGAGATFNCINMAQQVQSELNQERQSYESCIRELETALANSQKEVKFLSVSVINDKTFDID